jgi:hypothetical protein
MLQARSNLTTGTIIEGWSEVYASSIFELFSRGRILSGGKNALNIQIQFFE